MTVEEKILIKQFKPVTIQDDMMFGTVMADPKCCKPFLETILGTKIQKIEYPERQKTIALAVNAKSIRMDVYMEDEERTVYDEYIYRCGEYYQLSDGSYRQLGDDAWKIFVNADGHKGNVSDEFKILMRYIMEGEAKDPYTQTLEEKVTAINNNDEWKVSYMTWAIKLADERRDAREEGREEGRKEGYEELLRNLVKAGDLSPEKAAQYARSGSLTVSGT